MIPDVALEATELDAVVEAHLRAGQPDLDSGPGVHLELGKGQRAPAVGLADDRRDAAAGVPVGAGYVPVRELDGPGRLAVGLARSGISPASAASRSSPRAAIVAITTSSSTLSSRNPVQ